jgi:tetratricopeptide (TPR) repeat protein
MQFDPRSDFRSDHSVRLPARGHGALAAFALCVSCLLPCAARSDETEIRKLFAQAGQAYDAGQFQDAATRYEQILKDGFEAPAIFFNLGNAYFKLGNAGLAILNYRRAWALTPRDAELSANFRFAVQTFGALVPEPSIVSHMLTRLSMHEWIVVSTAGYWGAALLLILHLLSKSPRLFLLRAAVALALLTAVGALGILHWYGMQRRPEYVVTVPNQQAYFAPLDNSTAHFALPPGSIVRGIEASGSWLNVASGKDTGWIRGNACLPVFAWQTGKNP